jgi:hypothetical protein
MIAIEIETSSYRQVSHLTQEFVAAKYAFMGQTAWGASAKAFGTVSNWTAEYVLYVFRILDS